MVVHGAVWSEANDFAMKLASQEGAALIHPFDDPEVRTLVNTLAIINRVCVRSGQVTLLS